MIAAVVVKMSIICMAHRSNSSPADQAQRRGKYALPLDQFVGIHIFMQTHESAFVGTNGKTACGHQCVPTNTVPITNFENV